MSSDSASAVIVGGGVAGLSAARSLCREGHRVKLFEAGNRLGGALFTVRDGDFILEHGADAFVTSSDEVWKIITELGLQQNLVAQTDLPAYRAGDGGLERLDPGEAANLLNIQVTEQDVTRGVQTLRWGMDHLIEKSLADCRDLLTVEYQTLVTRLQPTQDGWTVSDSNGNSHPASAVILALPARLAAHVVERFDPAAGRELSRFPTESTISVHLDYPDLDSLPEASGLVVEEEPFRSQGLRALSFVSRKFPFRSPDHRFLIRGFVRPTESDSEPTREELLKTIKGFLSQRFGFSREPERLWINRWPQGLTRYLEDHDSVVEEISGRLRTAGPLWLAGSAYQRVGVAGAMRSGVSAGADAGSFLDPAALA